MLSDDFLQAMSEAIKEYGSQKAMAEATGIHQSRISDYVNGNYEFENLTVGTLVKLFPGMRIVYREGEKKTPDGAMEVLETRLLKIFRRLSVENKVLCFERVARTYGDGFDDK